MDLSIRPIAQRPGRNALLLDRGLGGVGVVLGLAVVVGRGRQINIRSTMRGCRVLMSAAVLPQRVDTLIVGGGVAGVSLAYHLALRTQGQHSVLVIDRVCPPLQSRPPPNRPIATLIP